MLPLTESAAIHGLSSTPAEASIWRTNPAVPQFRLFPENVALAMPMPRRVPLMLSGSRSAVK